jgi:putative ABC transport system permease protein
MIPYSYSLRNLWTRRVTTLLTASGMGLVVFVFAATLMLAEGLQKTLVQTGSPDNVVLIRKGSNSEVQSGVERDQAALLESQPEVAIGPDGNPLLAKELVVLINLKKRGSNNPANVVIRGVSAASLRLRPAVRLKEGRLPRPGSAEVVAGASIARRFQGGGLGETLRFGMRDWRVVGVFDAGATGFSSEIWGDVDQMMQAFRRQVYSSVVFRLRDSSRFDQYKARIEGDPRLTVEAKRETRYYLDQSESMATFLRILGMVLTVVFSIGAVIGATITMYAAVANRVTEIGTLRALGFPRSSILIAFVMEALLLGVCGGILGVAAASFMQLITISTMNWQSFSELAFSFALTFGIVWKSLLFSTVMGLVGGMLPALRASRMNIVEALRAT